MTTQLNKVTLHQELRGRGDLKSGHRDVLQALASYGNYNLTGIRVSVERVCRDYGLSENTVRSAISHCRKCGYLQLVKAGVGSGNPSEYVIVVPPRNSPNIGGFSKEDLELKPPKVCTGNPPNFELKPPKDFAKPPQTLGTNQLKTKYLPVKRHQGDADASDDFDIWFKAYPRQEQENRAKAAYAQARVKADAATLLTAAKKYREQVTFKVTEPKFVKMPANWLREERWRDFEMVTYRDRFDNERTCMRWEKKAMDDQTAKATAGRADWW